MDILIKGIELPKEGIITWLTLSHDGKVIVQGSTDGEFESKKELAKAIELPSHGRCVDVDTIIRQLRKWGDAPIKRDNFEIANLLESLAETDTVLEASK